MSQAEGVAARRMSTSSTLEASMNSTHSGDGFPYRLRIVRSYTADEIAQFCSLVLAEQEFGSNPSVFLALYDELMDLNQSLLSYVESVAANIRTPAALPLTNEISSQASRIRSRLSMMARLAADLKQDSKRTSEGGRG